jgi:hypothetical protein
MSEGRTLKVRVTVSIPKNLPDTAYTAILEELDAWGPPRTIQELGATVFYDFEIEVKT